eukprot:NODE_5078_length_727_cov_58.498333_g5055_i0.p1 GENE.NODE_5078_length_727_cov_58.498333_g5055_i0~~NODE_5078_length_727_cov_58.498333_g5055_i0.p1  ORF type:complete len:193 (-),score=36.43 NODE_5078_length_727_cov_58.498333_g5055_i0:95-673(-)
MSYVGKLKWWHKGRNRVLLLVGCPLLSLQWHKYLCNIPERYDVALEQRDDKVILKGTTMSDWRIREVRYLEQAGDNLTRYLVDFMQVNRDFSPYCRDSVGLTELFPTEVGAYDEITLIDYSKATNAKCRSAVAERLKELEVWVRHDDWQGRYYPNSTFAVLQRHPKHMMNSGNTSFRYGISLDWAERQLDKH